MTDATRVTLSWASGERFDAENAAGLGLTLDGDGELGFSPTESLLAAFCACMGIDVVVILEKMRLALAGVHITVDGERMPDPPRYFHRLRVHFRVEGDVPRDKVERAVRLSYDKYCSVFHTLRRDLDIETIIDVEAAMS